MFINTPVIGLAGGIGSGKSAVARILAQLGCVVTDSDADGRAALRDPVIRATLVEWWGKGVLDERGEVDRSAVAHVVFADRDELSRLEKLTHPWIERRRRAQWEQAAADTPALVIDAPLIFEVGLDAACDRIIFVQADREIRQARVMAARGWDETELTRREDSQIPLDEKRSRADYVVQNNGDFQQLTDDVRQVLNEIVQTARESRQPQGGDERCAETPAKQAPPNRTTPRR